MNKSNQTKQTSKYPSPPEGGQMVGQGEAEKAQTAKPKAEKQYHNWSHRNSHV
jgi:hypothetical protein